MEDREESVPSMHLENRGKYNRLQQFLRFLEGQNSPKVERERAQEEMVIFSPLSLK